MKKLLIAGGSHSELPLIQAAQKLGYFVLSSGNNPADQGHQYSNETILSDYSDQEAMLKLAQDNKVDAICPGCNDFSMISSAYVAENLHLAGYDSYQTTLLLHHKNLFREFALKAGYPVPQAYSFCREEFTLESVSALAFPMIVKPVDLTGGKGVQRVDNQQELAAAVQNAFSISRAKHVVIERFIEGSLHSYSCFLKDQKVVFAYHDNEYSYLNPYLVSTSAGPSKLSRFLCKEINECIETLATQLNLVDGLLHAQLLCHEQQFCIVEFTRRCPGDFYAWPVSQSTGIDYSLNILKPYLNHSLNDLSDYHQSKWVGRHCVMADQNGKIMGLSIASQIREQIQAEWVLKTKNPQIRNYLVDKERILFLEFASEQEMLFKTQQLTDWIRLELDTQ